jgi:hypothetical protein
MMSTATLVHNKVPLTSIPILPDPPKVSMVLFLLTFVLLMDYSLAQGGNPNDWYQRYPVSQ